MSFDPRTKFGVNCAIRSCARRVVTAQLFVWRGVGEGVLSQRTKRRASLDGHSLRNDLPDFVWHPAAWIRAITIGTWQPNACWPCHERSSLNRRVRGETRDRCCRRPNRHAATTTTTRGVFCLARTDRPNSDRCT